MTTIDDARLRDQAIPDLDWRVFPAGTERDVLAAPSGGLARVQQGLWPQAQHDAYAARIGARVATYPTGHAPCETAPHQLARDLLRLYADAG